MDPTCCEYVLTDDERAAFERDGYLLLPGVLGRVIPGSHLSRQRPERDPREVTARAGDALLFDRRLWHSASTNHSRSTRRVLFYGYSYRWLRPKSAMQLPDLLAHTDPIRRQLLGWATSANGYFEAHEADVPLRAWIARHLGPEAVAA